MHADIYKFSKKEDMYVYIARPDYPEDSNAKSASSKDWLAVLPKDFRQAIGRETFVMHLDLDATEKLARVDKNEVVAKLKAQGYYVQMPADDILLRQASNKLTEAQQTKWQ